jgi:epoxyqueuosine reductase
MAGSRPRPVDAEWITAAAQSLGFDACGIAPAQLPAAAGERLARAIADGHHATMTWLADTFERRRQPRAMWGGAKSAIVLATNYGPQSDPLAGLKKRDGATISVYARNRDYHDLMKGRMKMLAGKIAARLKAEVKVFVDTAPLMEKPLAQLAGIGWQGKHTNLVSRNFGSWLFLGAILTDAALPADEAETDHCGQCRACLDICPTNAFPAPYRLDARRCISYLTIEHDGPIPREFRKAMGNRVFGCDDCLAVCPFNKFARAAREAKLAARAELDAPDLRFLAALDEAAFRAFFAGSPVKRTGRARFLRNVLIAIGNSGEQNLAESALAHVRNADPQVRGAAAWALRQLLGEAALSLRDATEKDATVIAEWEDSWCA